VRGPRRRRGVRRYLVQEWSDETLPVHAFLLEHPQGLCLVDVGQTAAAARPGYFPPHPFFRLSRFELEPADEVAEQVRALGFDPADVGRVVLTHLHTDHVGGLAAFAHADVVVSETEWRHATGLAGALRGYLPTRWPRVLPRLVRLDGPPVGPFASSHDLTGDGSLLLVPLPGHTPGQIGVLAGGAALLVGDAAHDALELEAAEPAIADYCRKQGILVLAAHDDGVPTAVEVPLGETATAANGR
jgi:N-acyl homoserine lactone hydrolase